MRLRLRTYVRVPCRGVGGCRGGGRIPQGQSTGPRLRATGRRGGHSTATPRSSSTGRRFTADPVQQRGGPPFSAPTSSSTTFGGAYPCAWWSAQTTYLERQGARGGPVRPARRTGAGSPQRLRTGGEGRRCRLLELGIKRAEPISPAIAWRMIYQSEHDARAALERAYGIEAIDWWLGPVPLE